MTSVVVNDSPLLIELFAPMRFDDANDNDDPDKATFEALKELSRTRTQLDTAKRQTAHLKTLTDAELATLTLRPGDVVGGRVIVHATESEPIVGISVALRAAVHWAAPTAATPTTGTGVVSARDAAFGRAEEDLFRLVQVLFGANIMASLDMARTMPHERLSRGTHVLPFSLRLPDRPPSTVLPSFAVPALGVAVTYTLSAVLERRDAGASNLVRPLPADSAALSAIAQAHYLEAGKTKSLHSRAVAASAYPRPTPVHSASEHQPHRAIAASAPKASSPEPQYAAPPIVVIDLPHLGRNRTSTAASAVSANERPDSGYGVVGGGHELPQPPTNAMPAEAGYGVVDENGAPVNSSGYAGVPFANADAPYHSVPPLAGEEDTDPDDVVEPYAPIDSKRESHTFDTVALPETVAVSSTAAARPTRVESGGGGGGAGAGSRLRLPEIVHPVKSPRLARPQPVRGISGAHIAATIVSLQCMGARVLTPPRDWQVVSAESSKKRLFSRKLVRLEMKLPRSVFVAGHTVNVSIVCTGGSAKHGKLKLRRVVWIRDARPVPVGGLAREETMCDTSASAVVDESAPEGASPRRKSAVDASMSATHAAEIATINFNRRQSEAVQSSLAVPSAQTTDDDDGETRTMTAAFQLPNVLVPSCQSRNVRISYQLHFVLKSRFRSDQSVSLPIKIIADS